MSIIEITGKSENHLATSRQDCLSRLLSGTSLASKGLLAAGLVCLPLSPLAAGPVGEQIVAGDVAIERPSTDHTDIHQHGDKAIVNWKDFSIGIGESVSIHQPTVNSLILNRVTGDYSSEILGQLNADGRVMLINPNGILFGDTARIDVAGLIATTSDISDDNFLASRYELSAPDGEAAAVINKGLISARDGGMVAFVAPNVANSGVITARFGEVHMASGRHFTLDLYGDSLVHLALDDAGGAVAGMDALVSNAGTIQAQGGQVHLSARAASGVVDTVINMSGVIEAHAVADVGGRIVLAGGDYGQMVIAGELDVAQTSSEGDGGTVDITGADIAVSGDARFDASAGETGDGGSVVLYADASLVFSGDATATGGAVSGDGGFVETSGGRLVVTDAASVDTRAVSGRYGLWSLDPETLSVVDTVSADDGSEVAASTIVSQLETTSVELAATNTISVDAEIDSSSQSSATTLAFVDEDSDNDLTVDLNAPITLGDNQVLSGEATTVNVYDGAEIQDAVYIVTAGASASSQTVINVYPGDYTEGTANVSMAGDIGGPYDFGLHLFKDNVRLRGVDGSGSGIADAGSTEAVITAAHQSAFGAQHFVYGDGVTVEGLTFLPAGGGDNKAFEVIGDDFILRNSTIDNSGSDTGVALYFSEFGDVDGIDKDVETFTVEDNRFIAGDGSYYMVAIASGAGDGSSASNRRIADNVFEGVGNDGESGIRFNGIVGGVAWLIHDVGAATISGNRFAGLADPISARGDGLPDFGWDDLFANNSFDDGAILTTDSDGAIRSEVIDYSGATTDYMTITTDISYALGLAEDGDRVAMKDGTYTSDSTLGINSSITLSGESEDGTIIDTSGVSVSYGLRVEADDVSLGTFTLYGPAVNVGTSYGIKVQPDTTDATDRLTGFSIADVTVRGSGRAELDLNGVNGATITNFTANGYGLGGADTETAGAGIQLTDSANIALSNIVTQGNSWGGLAIYQANRFYDQQADAISLSGENSFSETNAIYTQDTSDIHDIGDLTLADVSHVVLNAEAYPDYVYYQTSEQGAIDLAVAVSNPDASNVHTWMNGDVGTDFIVGVSTGGDAMSIGGAANAATAGATIYVRAGEYTDAVELAVENVTIAGAQAGVAADGRSGEESMLTGTIAIEGTADGATIDGLTLAGGGLVQGSLAGIYLASGAADITITNTVLARSGGADGDGYRGILTVANGGNIGLSVSDSHLSGWATGVYLNPGATDAAITDTVFDSNYVGMSVDGPDGVVLTGNSFTNSGLEGLGIGPGAETPNLILTGNDFDGNVMHVGVWTDITLDLTESSFGGIAADDLSYSQLLATEALVGHGLDTGSGYAGYALLRNDAVVIGDGNSLSAGLALAGVNDIVVVGDADMDTPVSFDGARQWYFGGTQLNDFSVADGVTPEIGGSVSVTEISLPGGLVLIDDLEVNAVGQVSLASIEGAYSLTISSDTADVTTSSDTDLASLRIEAGSIRLGGVTTSGSQEYTGSVSLEGATYIAGSWSVTGETLLTTDTSIETDGLNGSIIFSDHIDGSTEGGEDLSLIAGTGTVTHDNIGQTVRLGDLTIVAGDYDGSSGTTNIVNLSVDAADVNVGNNTVNATGRVGIRGDSISGAINAEEVSIEATETVTTSIVATTTVRVTARNLQDVTIEAEDVEIEADETVEADIEASESVTVEATTVSNTTVVANNATISATEDVEVEATVTERVDVSGNNVSGNITADRASVTAEDSVAIEVDVVRLDITASDDAVVTGTADRVDVGDGSTDISVNGDVVEAPEPAPEPEPEPELIVAEVVAAPEPVEPAPEPPLPAISGELFEQSFVRAAPEPEPEPEPQVAASGLPIWLDLPDMTPTLEGLQTEVLEVALAEAPAEIPDEPQTPTAAPRAPEPEIAAAPEGNCDTASPSWALFLFDTTQLGDWGRVPNVRVVPMGFCAETRQALEGQMRADGRLGAVRGAAAGDQLVSLALQRAGRGPQDVFAMATEGAVLNVYVY